MIPCWATKTLMRKYIENRKAMETNHMIIETKEFLHAEEIMDSENSNYSLKSLIPLLLIFSPGLT